MTPSVRLWPCVVLAALLVAGVVAPVDAAPQPASAAAGNISVKAELDRPAIWVADRVTYTVEITCRNGVDIVIDDLSREKLKLGGLDVVGSDNGRQADADAIRYAFHYVLTTYRVDVPTLTIAPLPVRYYVTRTGHSGDSAPAGTVQVPAATVAFRSLLPDDQPSYQARDSRPVAARWLPYRVLAPVGLGLILLSVAPVVFLGLGLVRGTRWRRESGARRSTRQARQTARAALDEIRAAEPATAEARRAAFARLDALVRQHLADVCGVPAAGLTPSEMATSLDGAGTQVPPGLVVSVLTSCELARYAGAELRPSADVWRDTLPHAEEVLAAGR